MYTGGTNIPNWFCFRCKIKWKTVEECECQCLLGGNSSSILKKKSTRNYLQIPDYTNLQLLQRNGEFCLAQA